MIEIICLLLLPLVFAAVVLFAKTQKGIAGIVRLGAAAIFLFSILTTVRFFGGVFTADSRRIYPA